MRVAIVAPRSGPEIARLITAATTAMNMSVANARLMAMSVKVTTGVILPKALLPVPLAQLSCAITANPRVKKPAAD